LLFNDFIRSFFFDFLNYYLKCLIIIITLLDWNIGFLVNQKKKTSTYIICGGPPKNKHTCLQNCTYLSKMSVRATFFWRARYHEAHRPPRCTSRVGPRSALKSNNYGDNFVLKIFLWNFYIQRRPWQVPRLFFNTRSTYFFSGKKQRFVVWIPVKKKERKK